MSMDSLTPQELGERLRVAREAAGMTQARAANEVQLARTTLIAIEKGGRRARMEELQKLAKLYGTHVNSLLRREAVHVDLVPRFRRVLGAPVESVQEASKLLAAMVRAEVELENLLGIQRVYNYPAERPLLPGNVAAQAEHDALELRQRCGLSIQPVIDIAALLETEFGVRVYVRKFDGRISGLFAYEDKLGACMLLNANHPIERRNQTAAHELGHLISARYEPDILHIDSPERSPEEKYANVFGRCFLTPARALIQKLQEITVGSSNLTRRHVILLAHEFRVSREAVVRRLEELKLTNSGTWDWFQANGGITDSQARQVLGELRSFDERAIEAKRPVALRLANLAYEVWRRELLSEGQLAKLLNVGRLELREILTDIDSNGEAGNDGPKILK